MLTIAFSPSLPPLVLTLLYLFFLFFTSLSTCSPPPPTVLLPSFSVPLLITIPSSSSFAPLLNAPSGGFGYTGMQSSSHSQFSYSLPQGSRVRNQSSDVNEALYNLDRVLQGKSAAYKHERTGCVCQV